MKLITTIPPRTDGTVRAEANGNRYVFTAGPDGVLACDVKQADADVLLKTGHFVAAEVRAPKGKKTEE